MCKLYNTWRKVKDTFVKPSLKVYFGLASKDPYCCWTKPKILLYRSSNLIRFVQDSVTITTGSKTEKFGNKDFEVKVAEISRHKLPKNLKDWDIVWASPIRRKLRKYHLNWIPPIIYLPKFFTFKFVNFDVGWKTKYDDIRYEYPPQLSIVFFGLSLTFTLHCPIKDEYCSDDSYWEAILLHLYRNKSGNLKEIIEQAGVWHRFSTDCRYFAVRPEYIVKEKLEEYYAAVSDFKVKSKYMNTI